MKAKNNDSRLRKLESVKRPGRMVVLYEDEEQGAGRLFLDDNFTQEVDQSFLDQLEKRKSTVVILSYEITKLN